MERSEWLRQMREQAEALYDHLSPLYWVTFGKYENAAHRAFLRKFLDLVKEARGAGEPGAILSAACGAGRYDGLLLEAGHSVLGIDQSARMLAQAREHFPRERYPQLRYEKMGLQEMDFVEAFDGAICVDALEHVPPEDYPGILRGLQEALKPGGVLYFTVDQADAGEIQASYERARARGLPVVFGEVADKVEQAYQQARALGRPLLHGELADAAVYHYYPPLEQVREWVMQAGLAVIDEGAGSGYYHFIARKSSLS